MFVWVVECKQPCILLSVVSCFVVLTLKEEEETNPQKSLTLNIQTVLPTACFSLLFVRENLVSLAAQRQTKKSLRRLFPPRNLENRTLAVFLVVILYTLGDYELPF